MSNEVLSKQQQKIAKVEIKQDRDLTELSNEVAESTQKLDSSIDSSEALLRSLGYASEVEAAKESIESMLPKKAAEVIIIRSWEELSAEAESCVDSGTTIESIFTKEELLSNKRYIAQLDADLNNLHRLDPVDYCIAGLAGVLSGLLDILLVGIPEKTPEGLRAGPLSDWVRKRFNEKFPQEEMQNLANNMRSKVSYDAQDNRNTIKYVNGLSAYYHRLLSFGHDPLLGFLIGVMDIMTGSMTTIDKTGNIVSQTMAVYADRKATNIFAALAKQLAHLKSDVTTSMGLPAPMMAVFNLFQIGNIGEYHQTVAEIVQGMYYEGYDFIHFCSMSMPVMLTEVLVRVAYCIKRVKEGHSLKDSIPFSLNRVKHPKLETMLFVAHSAATAINAGKVLFTSNPMAINYPQWMAFAKYSYQMLKWTLIQRPELQQKFVEGKLSDEWGDIYTEIEDTFNVFAKDHIVLFE